MLTIEQAQLDRIEADRKRRERELLLLLLLLARQSRRYVLHAIRLDTDPLAALRLVWLGGPHFPGAVTPLANAMAQAHVAGWQRAMRIAPMPETVGRLQPGATSVQNLQPTPIAVEPALKSLAKAYRTPAFNAASQAMRTLADGLNVALGGENTPEGRIRAAKQAFSDGGWAEESPTNLKLIASTQIVPAFGAGMYEAAMNNPDVKGFVHVSILDKSTTLICKQRDGFARPKDDNYWNSGFPPLHFSCRSVLMPVMTDGPWSTTYPTEPPAPGFGQLPFGVLFTKRAA